MALTSRPEVRSGGEQEYSGYWGDRAPRIPFSLCPMPMEPQWLQRGARQPGIRSAAGSRRIDVLVAGAQEQWPYVLNRPRACPAGPGPAAWRFQRGWVEESLSSCWQWLHVVAHDPDTARAGRSRGFGAWLRLADRRSPQAQGLKRAAKPRNLADAHATRQ